MLPTGFKHSEQTKLKMSLIKKGKPGFWKGKTRPHTEETKRRMSETQKRIGNKPPVLKGINSPNWKGGVSKDRRTGTKYIQWRSKVFQRDNWTCQTCGLRGCYLEAHHIKSWAHYLELRYVLENGVTLCLDCHKLTNNYKGKNNS